MMFGRFFSLPCGSRVFRSRACSAAGALLLASLCLACASKPPAYRDQIDVLALNLTLQHPTQVEEVIDFAVRSSYRLNLGLPGLDEELAEILKEPGPWWERVLFAYLLALAEEWEGFAAVIDILRGEHCAPELREGLHFCGLKYLGITEGDALPQVFGWEVNLHEWAQIRDFIRKEGLHAWRRERIKEIVLSGEPRSGDRAQKAASWLSYTLSPMDVPFLGDLLEKGSPKCDVALLEIIEHLVMVRFQPEGEEDGLNKGIEAFRAWYAENSETPPDQWITLVFKGAGYDIEDLYKQRSLTHILPGLFDESERWILIRSHTLRALNRICGFHVDRSIIFMDPEVRTDAALAYRQWYKELARQVKYE